MGGRGHGDEPAPRDDAGSAARGGRFREAARNDRLVELAAREVVARLGAEAPMTEIARRAGVGIASVYRRYPTRQQLLQRLAADALTELVEAVEVANRTPDPHHAVRRFVERLVEADTAVLLPLIAELPSSGGWSSSLTAATRQLDELVARGRWAGVIRREVTGPDLVLLARRFASFHPTAEERRSLALAIDGLLLVPHRALTGPEPTWRSVLGTPAV